MPKPEIGDTNVCSSCGAKIQFLGTYWAHMGNKQPRHPAKPMGIQKKEKPEMPKIDEEEAAERIASIIEEEISWKVALASLLRELTELVKDFRQKLKEETKNAKG